jgi:uncharacterized RDD family membrane protein YckC
MTTPRRGRAHALQGKRAGIISRLIADGIDLVAVIVWYVGLLVAYAVVKFLLTSADLRLPRPGATFNSIAIIVVQIVYLGIGWSGTTRTVGKELMGLRVVRSDGRLLARRWGFLRAVVCTFIGEPLLLWAAVSHRNAAVYDLWLDTAVIYDWRTSAQVLEAVEAAEPLVLDHAG